MCGLLISAVNTTTLQIFLYANISITPWEPLTSRSLISEAVSHCVTGDRTDTTRCLGNDAWCNWTSYRKGHICEKSPRHEILCSQTKGGDAKEENSDATNDNICTCCGKQESGKKYPCECYSLCCNQTSDVKIENKENYDNITRTCLYYCDCPWTQKCREQQMFTGGHRRYRNYTPDNKDVSIGKCDIITQMSSVNRHGKEQNETGSQVSQGVIVCLTEDRIEDSRCLWNETCTSGVREANGDTNVDWLIETICLKGDMYDLLFWHEIWPSQATGLHDDGSKVNNCTASLDNGHCSRGKHECCKSHRYEESVYHLLFTEQKLENTSNCVAMICLVCINCSASRNPVERQSFEDSGCHKTCRIHPLGIRGVSTEMWDIRTRICSLHLCEKYQHEHKSEWKDDESKSYNPKLKDKYQAKEMYLIGLLHVIMSLVFVFMTDRSILKWLCVKIRKKKRYFKDTNRVYKDLCGFNEVNIKNDYICYRNIRNMVTKIKATFFGNRSSASNILSFKYIIKTFEVVKCTTASDNFCCMKSHIEQAGDDFMSMLYGLKGNFISIPQVTVFPLITTLNNYLSRVLSNESVPPDKEMCYEVRRFKSFNSVPVRASPMRLAQSGFYATGRGDETRCYSCRMTYGDWRLMDQPDGIHRSMSPDCPHLNNTDRRNEPILSSASDSDVTTVRGVIGEYPITNGSSENVTHQPDAIPASNARAATPTTETQSSALAGLDISKAVYPQYRDVSSRLDSYQGWGWSHVQDPQVLARAGFYYAGYRDCVRCFYCGVGLRTWEREDDPWVEHVRWRSSCDYVRLMRGEQFAIQALANNPSIASTLLVQPVDTQTHNTVGGTDVVVKAEEMGFQRDLIERVMREMTASQRTSGHRDIIQLETLLEKLIVISEDLQTTSTASHSVPANTKPTASSTQQMSLESSTSSLKESHIVPPDTVTSTPARAVTKDSLSTSVNSQTALKQGDTKSGKRSKGNTKQTKGDNYGKHNENHTDPEVTDHQSANQERQLEEENQSLRDESTCKICLDNPSCIVFLPCGHLVTCAECAPALSKCPICRALIRGTVRAHTVSSDNVNM